MARLLRLRSLRILFVLLLLPTVMLLLSTSHRRHNAAPLLRMSVTM